MTERSALATAAAIRSGETTALAECDAAIARIEACDGAINAVVVRDFDRARRAAVEIDQRRAHGFDAPLIGVPMTVKESYDVAGLPTTWGLEEHRDFIPDTDAVAVKRLKAAGAVLLGKTNVPPSLADLQSTNPVYGRTNHPDDDALTPGGSSGGSAAAVASGMVPIEIGSDIGGSIRVPASFCGIWGHKSTYGTLSIEGQILPGTDGAAIAMSVIGPMARDADDLAAVLDVMADIPLPRARAIDPAALRILVLTSHPVAPVASAISDGIDEVARALSDAGATVNRVSALLPDLAQQFAQYMRLLSITLARGAPSDEGVVATLPDWLAMLDDQARNARSWRRLFADYDAVIAPALGTQAYPHSDLTIRERTLTINGETSPFGLQFAFPGLATYPGLPATAMPVGRANDLPVGCQVITDFHQDHTAIAIAKHAHELLR
ncbi:amidase family protein [Sphingomonas oligophenolica]|uniref:Amidase n=1 Tax=Sphingomonas oligophenolica TaxID=301154 RepID=A0A502CI82_9SPHN|nr:amidase family protein [Sphingomonas oligophenolica]TPG12432.1 amidase [Sphingomonas oligophenolica]